MGKTFYEGVSEKSPSFDFEFMKRFEGVELIDRSEKRESDYIGITISYHIEPQGVTLLVRDTRFGNEPWKRKVLLYGSEESISAVESRINDALNKYESAKQEAARAQQGLESLAFKT